MTRGFPIRMQPGSSATNYGSNVAIHQLRPGSNAFNLRLAQMAGQGKSPAPFMGGNNPITSSTNLGIMNMNIPRGPFNIHPMTSPKGWTDLNKMPGWKLPVGVLGAGAGIIGGAIELADSAKPTPLEAHTEMLMADPYAVQSDGRTTMEHYIEKYGFSALPESLRWGN